MGRVRSGAYPAKGSTLGIALCLIAVEVMNYAPAMLSLHHPLLTGRGIFGGGKFIE